MSDFVNSVTRALRQESWDRYEELWLEAMEGDSVPFRDFVAAARRGVEAGHGQHVAPAFSLLRPIAETLPLDMRREYFEILVTCSPKDRSCREALLDVYREQFGDAPGFETFVKTADLMRTPDPAAAIQSFANLTNYLPGTYVYHRSGWGVGQITELAGGRGEAIVDFEGKPGHRVQVDALPEICDKLDDNHFLVLQWRFPERLEQLRENQPAELVKCVLRASSKPLPLARIREQLVGSVIPTGSWSKWWTRARTALKKDGEVATTGSRTPEYFLLEGPEGLAASLERRFANRTLREKLRILREAVDEASEEERAVLPQFLERLAQGVLRADAGPEVRLAAVLFLRRNGVTDERLPSVADILSASEHPGDVINLLARLEDQKEVIDLLREQAPEEWVERSTELLLRADDGPRRYLIDLLQEAGRAAEIDQWAREVARLPRKAPMFFLWLVRKVGVSELEDIPCLAEANGIDLYLKALSLLNDFAVRSAHEQSRRLDLLVKRYKQVLAGRPFRLLISLVRDAELPAVRNVYHRIESSSAFSGTMRQGLLAAILREQPSVLVSATRATGAIDESVIYATDAGIQRRRTELEEIRNEKLPAIFKLIGDAAEFGDLSENAEFTSAIEEREKLNRRAMEIQEQLDRVRRIDPSQAARDHVTLGSVVGLIDLESQERSEFQLLGPWDGGPDDGVLSYLSPIGRALLDRHPGDEFTVELPEGSSRFRVETISGGAPVGGDVSG